jgi:protease I
MKERFRRVPAKALAENRFSLKYFLFFAHKERKLKERKMKRLSFIVAILLSLLMINTIAEAQATSQVLLNPPEGKSDDIELSFDREFAVMVNMLQKAGFRVVVANVSGQPIEGLVKKLRADMKLSEVNVDDYAGFILPCMGVGQFAFPPVPPVAISIVKQAVAKGKPVAAAHSSVYILAEAGVLKGKRFAFPLNPFLRTSYSDSKWISRFEGAIYGGSSVIQDGNIITSGICPILEAQKGLPDLTPGLTRAFIEKLNQKSRN